MFLHILKFRQRFEFRLRQTRLQGKKENQRKFLKRFPQKNFQTNLTLRKPLATLRQESLKKRRKKPPCLRRSQRSKSRCLKNRKNRQKRKRSFQKLPCCLPTKPRRPKTRPPRNIFARRKLKLLLKISHRTKFQENRNLRLPKQKKPFSHLMKPRPPRRFQLHLKKCLRRSSKHCQRKEFQLFQKNYSRQSLRCRLQKQFLIRLKKCSRRSSKCRPLLQTSFQKPPRLKSCNFRKNPRRRLSKSRRRQKFHRLKRRILKCLDSHNFFRSPPSFRPRKSQLENLKFRRNTRPCFRCRFLPR